MRSGEASRLAFISQAVSRAILQGYEQIHKQHTPAMAQQEQPRLLQEQPPQYHGQHHDEALSQTFKQKEQQPPIDQHRRSEPPSALTESHLLLVVNGCVESVNIGGRRGGTVCRYTTVVGRDWKQIWGLAGGLSQEGHCGDCTLEVTLNFPFQAAFQVFCLPSRIFQEYPWGKSHCTHPTKENTIVSLQGPVSMAGRAWLFASMRMTGWDGKLWLDTPKQQSPFSLEGRLAHKAPPYSNVLREQGAVRQSERGVDPKRKFVEHQMRLPVYSIVESSIFQRFLAWLKAERAEYIDLQTAAKTQGKEG
ncbi:hypothetical protein cyc_01693 [Cyclospora cayetanensis]|uniref:Uncharacterized protein n=1 Tax=Cyclospora cayetanensis TaxID=88456 RepID=A0A1D3CRZ4_9EIME|nr:hypothetical protein cyc_01693 [Cyclospora cayetanensis]